MVFRQCGKEGSLLENGQGPRRGVAADRFVLEAFEWRGMWNFGGREGRSWFFEDLLTMEGAHGLRQGNSRKKDEERRL